MIRQGKSSRWPKAISFLLSEPSIELAAEKTGISKRTMCRWLKDSEFREQYRSAKADVLKSAAGIMTRNAGKAALALEEIFAGKPTPHQGARVAAARATFELALQAFELENLEERIRRLEMQGNEN